MTFFSRYMGTKRLLAHEISAEISQKKPGAVLDLFSGMSAVGEAVGSTRVVWGNDIQLYAYEVMRSMFLDPDTPYLLENAERCLRISEVAKQRVYDLAPDSFSREKNHLSNGSLEDLTEIAQHCAESRATGDLFYLAAEGERSHNSDFCASFTSRYGGAYFSLEQAAQIDSIRWSLDQALETHEINLAAWRRMLVCLGRASLSVSNTTGHFAQFLKPKERNARRYKSTMMRDVNAAFLSACAAAVPAGTEEWRRKNSAFNAEAMELLDQLELSPSRPGVIYCDPPYTADHYSRYYHVLETLILADYPSVTGAGLYRPDRHTSQFSIKTKVANSVANMIKKSAQCGADIVLSYPQKGLLEGPEKFILDQLSKSYTKVEKVRKLGHLHSSMGASSGSEKLPVIEYLFSASASKYN